MHHKTPLKGLMGIVIIGALIVGFLQLQTKPAYSPPSVQQVDESVATSEEPAPIDHPQYDVQPLINEWLAGQTGKASVVVYDLENDAIIGSANQDEVYFAASIYKLYVAYEGYLAVQRGEYDINEIYLSGQTRGECLDLMIRESDSPCAEKLWNELGKQAVTDTLSTYGITNTSLVGITTTAGDAATMLRRLYQNDEMNPEYKQLFFDSMKDQIYRDALASSFSDVVFYDKVGFNGLQEYHDVGILELPNGRHYVVSVLTDGVGTSRMKLLGAKLLDALNVAE